MFQDKYIAWANQIFFFNSLYKYMLEFSIYFQNEVSDWQMKYIVPQNKYTYIHTYTNMKNIALNNDYFRASACWNSIRSSRLILMPTNICHSQNIILKRDQVGLVNYGRENIIKQVNQPGLLYMFMGVVKDIILYNYMQTIIKLHGLHLI